MKVALFTDGIFPYAIGGMQKHSFNLVKYFAKSKVSVDLYHTNHSKYDIFKLEFFSGDEKKYIHSFVIDFPSFVNFPGHYLKESFEYSVRIFNLFSQNSDVDFIYAKGFSAWKLIQEKSKGYKCAPIGINFHGYEMFQKAASVRSKFEHLLLLRNPVLFNIKHADYVFSYGSRITDLILKLGVEQKRIIESSAGIAGDWIVQNIPPSQGIRKFIFVGRFEQRKGVKELIRVLSKLTMSNCFEFYFIGDIPIKHRISLPRVSYLGKITDSGNLKKILRTCDVLVCPSYSEGMPNVILEAMACGLSVIASDVGAVDILVSKKNGWLISAGNIKELKSALIEAMQTSELKMDEMKKHSNRIAGKFLWENIISLLIDQISTKVKGK